MPQATMTSKGQITVPREVRDDLGLEPGSKVVFVKLPSGRYQLLARTGTIDDLIGILRDPGSPSLTIDEMNDAIADAAAESGLGEEQG